MKYLFLVICLFCLISCDSMHLDDFSVESSNSSIELTPEEYLSITLDNEHEFSQEDIHSMVLDFISLTDTLQTRSNDNKSVVYSKREIISKESYNYSRSNFSDSDTIPIYNVTFRDNEITHHALVSADKRAPGVIAYVTTNSTSDTNLDEVLNCSNYKTISTLAKMQLIKDIHHCDSIVPILKKETISKICKTLNIDSASFSISKIKNRISIKNTTTTRTHAGIDMPSQQIIIQKTPMSQILWDQKTPYNRGCPSAKVLISIPGIGNMLIDDHVPAGCVTIACMNVEACIERNSIGGIPMNWTYYKSSKTLFEAVEGQSGGTPALELDRAGKAIRYIYDALNSWSNYSFLNGDMYVHSTGSSSGSNYIINNFNCSDEQSFDPDVVLSSLNANKPVYVSGIVIGNTVEDPDNLTSEGHAFVIDGYIICEKSYSLNQIYNEPKTRSDIVKYYDMYWHLNLGWGNGSSAYFKLESDATCSPEFIDRYGRYNLMHLNSMKIIPNISKK